MIPKVILKRIDQKLAVLQASQPLSASIVKKLKEQFSFELIYNSNGIEGNRLTLKETDLLINYDVTAKGKSFKDHLEAKKLSEAVHFVYELIEHREQQTISEHLIHSLQQLIVKNTEDNEGGRYRQGNVLVTGSKHQPPDAFEVPKLMHELVTWVNKSINHIHPIELAALAHHRLVHIHPFADGNGHTARLFMNVLLMQKGYPLVVILKNDRQKYDRSLEKANMGHTNEIEKFVAQAVERSMNLYLKAIYTNSNPNEKWVPLSTLAKQSTFSGKYLNILAVSGKLEAYKEGRNWLSSKFALETYLAGRERKRI